MESTFLLHKPVSYGSALANNVFLTILFLHIIAGAIAPITAIAVTTYQKIGGRDRWVIQQKEGVCLSID